jgi:hypothetical protein
MFNWLALHGLHRAVGDQRGSTFPAGGFRPLTISHNGRYQAWILNKSFTPDRLGEQAPGQGADTELEVRFAAPYQDAWAEGGSAL